MAKIAQASISEKKAIFGKKGNQNGNELNISNIKKNNFKYVLRFVNRDMAEACKIIAESGVKNKHIGYSQYDRMSLWVLVKNVYMALGTVAIDCNCDCASYVSTVCELAHWYIRREWMPNMNMEPNAPTTSNMLKKFRQTGLFYVFEKINITELKEGDILLTPGKHTAIVVEV